MKIKQKSYIVFLIITLLLLFPTIVDAEDSSDASSRTLRVAYPIQNGLTEKDAQGIYSGYTYDYLQEIAQYTGWEYEFVEVPGDSNESLMTMLNMLEKGEVDLMGSLSKNEQTEALFDFPEYGYGYSYTSLFISEDNTEINESNLQSVKELRIAAYKNATISKTKTEEFCSLNNINYSFVDCDSEQAIVDAVRSGDADVMLGNDLSPISGFRIVAQFSGSQFYFATPKGDSELLSALNSTILSIKQTNPYFESTLHEKYFSNRSYKTYLTDAEKQYVASLAPLKIIFVTNMTPIQFKDENGNISGITRAVLNRISAETGIQMEYLSADTLESAYSMLENKEADAVCGIPYDYRIAQEQNLVMSNRLFSSQVVMVSKDKLTEDGSEKKAAVIQGREIDNPDSNVTLKAYKSVEESMKAVKSGEADYSYVNLYSAEYLDSSEQYKGLNQIPQSGKTMEYCLGIVKPVNTTLITLLNRGLSNISPSDMETLIYQNTIVNYNHVTFRLFIEQNPFLIIGIISAVFAILAIIGLSMYRFKVRAGKQLNIENERYLQLSQLANEYLYEYDFTKDVLGFSKEFAKLFALPDKIEQASKFSFQELDSKYNSEVTRILKEAYLTDETAASEHLCCLPDGTNRWYRNTRAEIKDEAGKKIYLIGKLTDIQKEIEEKQLLKQQSQVDSLTGIYNAATTKTVIQQKLDCDSPLGALLVIDIDNFKNVNDFLGHYMGDTVLKEFAGILANMANPADIAGRIGGDEFMYYLNNVPDQETLEAFCQNLCEKARRTYSDGSGNQLTITISIGAVEVDKTTEFDTLYRAADKLLYESKRKGRDCFTVG